jgi:DNA-binding beta-propeller fold protein YncE
MVRAAQKVAGTLYKKGFVMKNLFFYTAVASCLASGAALTAAFAGDSGYRIVKTIPLGGDGGWDYLTVDSAARRVYVSRSTHVVVMDADSGAVTGDIPDTSGVHGIALAPELGRGFTSNGRANSATIFDLKTLKIIGTAKAGENPDAIVYDTVSKRVFTLNGRSQDATVINAADGSVAGTIPLGGKPEFAVADGKGRVYVNIEDKAELVAFDANKLTVAGRWPMAPCEEPTGLAMDLKSRRLFAGCHNKLLMILDADSGKVVGSAPIGGGVDATAFDPDTKFIFSSNGDGTLTVVREESPDKFSVVETVSTKRGARTMALDAKTHDIFLATADFDPPAEGERRPRMKPGSFVILVASR